MIAIDTNILVYAHRGDSPFHEAADRELSALAESEKIWAIPWACLYEFLAIVTHRKIYNPSTPLPDAILQAECWLECPRLHLIGEGDNSWTLLKDMLTKGKIVGPQIHDARIAAVCLQNGVKTLWSADRDFSRVHGLEVINPLVSRLS